MVTIDKDRIARIRGIDISLNSITGLTNKNLKSSKNFTHHPKPRLIQTRDKSCLMQ